VVSVEAHTSNCLPSPLLHSGCDEIHVIVLESFYMYIILVDVLVVGVLVEQVCPHGSRMAGVLVELHEHCNAVKARKRYRVLGGKSVQLGLVRNEAAAVPVYCRRRVGQLCVVVPILCFIYDVLKVVVMEDLERAARYLLIVKV